MILRLFHAAAARPAIYNFIQAASGARYVHARLGERIRGIASPRYVLDVGGATGTLRVYWPRESRYICLDLERPKLEGFRKAVPDGLALQGDATAMPLATGSVDAVICTAVAHHLDEKALLHALAESRRVLAPHGQFVFLDALERSDRFLSRALWKVDRGAHPHTAERLRQMLAQEFEVCHWERFSVLHEYALAVLRKRS
jgi:ubiquinone/menaquinone biosynthesis C-methylase UbiE